MRLKSLEISGFKSFAKKSKLNFDAPISAIVGPNGSGKSNIAEGFKFVLGEQSIKSLRGKKGEDLIFNGTGGSLRMNKASVKVYLDNVKRVLPIDFDEVSIERIVHRDGVNEYFLNNSLVRLKDIGELLASANIGSTGHHIISQGEADRILNASLKDRRFILEDALGLKVYQFKKIESEKKLKKTEENIVHVESLRKEIAPHLRFLKKQVEKIEKSRVLRDELLVVYKEYLKREDVYLKLKKEQLEGALVNPMKELGEINNNLLRYKKEIEEANLNKGENFQLVTLEEKLQELNNEISANTRKIGQLEGEISSLSRMKEREEARLQNEENKSISFREVKAFKAKIDDIFSEAHQSNDIAFVKHIIQRAKEIFTAFIENHQHNESSNNNNFESDINSLRNDKENIISITKTKEEEANLLRSQIDGIKKEAENNKVETLEAEKKVFELISEKSKTEALINKLNIEVDTLRRDEEEYKKEMTEARALLGVGALDYHDLTFNIDEIRGEERHIQNDRRRHLEKMKIRIEEMGGDTSEDVLKEYQDATERDQFLDKEINDLEDSAQKLNQLIKELDEKINIKFKEGLNKINSVFNEYFNLMFGGGLASLKLVKSTKKDEEESEEEDIEEGVDIHVVLPRKKTSGLMMLSGGERALTSIALLFAISSVNPPPFIILDETDAALDEANSKKYGDMIENLSKHSQLILITHNRETMSRASIIYGVTMESGVSKLLSIKFDEGIQYAK